MKKSFLSLTTGIALATALIAKPTVAVYDLESPLTESGQTAASILSLGNSQRPLTHFDITRSLNAAISDDDVKAVILDIDSATLSLAQTQEIRSLLLKIREAKKDVWLYTEYLTPTTALLGSAANHMTLMPAGNVVLNGIHAETMYFKNLMDKIGVQAEVIHIGDFKSAGETFYRTGPSEPAAKQQKILIDSIFKQMTSLIADGRGITQEKMLEIIDMGEISPQKALELKLIDHLEYRTDFIKKAKAAYSKNIDFNRSYHLPDLDGPEIDGLFDVIKLMLNSGEKDKQNSPYIAVIALEGTITDASIASVRKEILQAARNKNCKALVLRVNSPGGSALASDVLWEATDEFKATKRPFIVSMGAVAASGGYYVAAGADQIFAQPGTITGSIGVVGMKFNIAGAMDKLGITTHSTSRGEHADLFDMTRSYTPEEEKLIRKSMLHVYDIFKKRITDGRGDRIKGDLEKLAGGRVYSGKDALEIGLIDQLGGLNQAIEYAMAQAESNEAKPLLLPEPTSPLEGMFAKPKKDEHEFIRATSPRTGPLAELRNELLSSKTLGLLGHQKAHQIQIFLNQLEAFQNHNILLITPHIPTP